MNKIPKFKNNDEANKYFMDIYNEGKDLPSMKVKIVKDGGFTTSKNWDKYIKITGTKYVKTNKKIYKVRNVLGMVEHSDLGTVFADDIEDALRKAKREYPNPSYLLQVTVLEDEK